MQASVNLISILNLSMIFYWITITFTFFKNVFAKFILLQHYLFNTPFNYNFQIKSLSPIYVIFLEKVEAMLRTNATCIGRVTERDNCNLACDTQYL